jgi:uncharacterized membrane protein SpoIIM required for sporulation
MILDVEKFIRNRRSEWDEFEAMVGSLESNTSLRLNLEEAQRYHYLYERIAADLAKLNTYASEPRTRSYLEGLVARGFGEMHGTARRLPFSKAFMKLITSFPQTVRRHARLFAIVMALFFGGAVFGALAIAYDSDSKSVLMPFSHLLGDPSDRVAEEEARKEDHMDGSKSAFSAQLMTHNTQVAIFTLALGMTFGVGTSILLFYNGVLIGAVIMDYILAGESVFLVGWLLPHGSVEIPAILLAGQGGLLLGKTLLFARGRMALAQRLKEIRGDLVVIIFGVGAMLIWAGVIESFFSQYHEPMLPYAVKIVFGTLQMIGVVVYFTYAGRSGESVGR